MVLGSNFVFAEGVEAEQKPVPKRIKKEAKKFIQNITDNAIENVVKNKNKDLKRENFEKIFMSNVDLDLILKFVLGRFWKNADEKEKVQLKQKFRDFNIDTWTLRFDDYSGQKVKIKDVVNASADGHYFVESEIDIPNKKSDEEVEPVNIKWRVYEKKVENEKGKTAKEFRIFDIVIENVSMVLKYKNEYAEVIRNAQKEKVDVQQKLISVLDERVENLEKQIK
jgi:phospholipid transport system substrate-binding protein